MILFVFLALQLAAIIGGAALLWRRVEQQQSEIMALTQALEAAKTNAAQNKRRAAEAGSKIVAIGGRVQPVASGESEAAHEATEGAAIPGFSFAALLSRTLPSVSVETLRGSALGLAAILPALAFPFAANHALVVACGLCIAAGMMLLAFDAQWRAAAWAGVVTAGVWSVIGFALHVAQAQPLSYSAAAALAGLAGLVNARLRSRGPGEATALMMAFAALVLGAQTGMIGPAGLAYGIVVGSAAIIGGISLRLENMHIAAFFATLIGLFVLSGQPGAAIWFTPVTAWSGALFLGVAAVRAPHLGPRGMTVAATGALTPLLGIAALYDSHHGLADPHAAGLAFFALAALLGGIIAAAAKRYNRGVAALKTTLWVLVAAAFTAAVAGSLLVLPQPFAATALGLIAVVAGALFVRFQGAVWRLSAVAAALLTAFAASSSIALVLQEAPVWSSTLIVLGGLAIPAALTGLAGSLLRRAEARVSGGVAKLAAIGLSVATADMVLRLVFSGGAPLMQPIGFVEAGFHIAAWLAIALAVAAREARRRVSVARKAGVLALMAAALAASLLISALWLTPFWLTLPASRVVSPILRFSSLGFLAPAALFWSHWMFWRARGAKLRTRLSFGAAAGLTACCITLLAMHPDETPAQDSFSPLLGAIAFALAIVANFAPNVISRSARRSDLQKNFHRDRRSEQRV